MKQLYEEIKKIHNWCFNCPHSDISRKAGRYSEDKEEKGLKGLYPLRLRRSAYLGELFSAESIVKNILGVTTPIDEEEPAEPTEEEKAEQEWADWEENFKISMQSSHYIQCFYLQKRGFTIDLDREFIIPEDDRETLRLLDQISNCHTQECAFNRSESIMRGTVDNAMSTSMAKIDFALLEKGKDFSKLMNDMYFPYYNRKDDISKCGYSWDLIRYYLDKYGIKLSDEEDSSDIIESERTIGLYAEYTPLERFHLCFSGKPAIDLIEYILMSNDYQEAILNPWRADKELYDGTIDIGPDYYNNFCLDYWGELQKQITHEIQEQSNSPVELRKYLYSLLKPFSYISRYLYAREDDAYINKEISEFLHDFAYANNQKYKAYIENKESLIKKIQVGEISSSGIPIKDLRNLGMFAIVSSRTMLLKSYLGSFGEDEILEFLFRGIKQFACYIEGQLLEIGHTKSLIEYQAEFGIIIIDKIDPIEIASACGWNIEYAYSLYRIRRSDISLIENITPQHPNILRADLGHDFPTTVLTQERRVAKSMADFVRYCDKEDLYLPFTKQAWRPLENNIFNKQGKPITAAQLAQCYQDQLAKGLIMPRSK